MFKQIKNQNFISSTTKLLGTLLLIISIAFGGSTMLRAFAEAVPTVLTDIAATATGIAPFDPLTFDPATVANSGQDSSTTNNIVRLGDFITYTVHVSLNGKDTTDLVSTLTLDNEADWTIVPEICLTDGVTPVSNISADKKTLTCFLIKDVTQGTNVTYKATARANTNGVNGGPASLLAYNTPACTADKTCIRATASVSATGAVTFQAIQPADTIITTNFAIDLSKKLPGENPAATPPTTYTPIFNKPNAAGTADGHVLQYAIGADAVVGSEPVQGDANDKISFVLKDTFSTTDPVGNVAASRLYNWDAANTATGCDKIGTAIGTLTCSQAIPGGPITINVTDVATNYPDGGGNLFGIKLSIWVPKTDIQTSQDCVANPGSCNMSVRNVVTGLDYPTSAPYNNPVGATTGNRMKSLTGIPNYGGVTGLDEPAGNNKQDFVLNYLAGNGYVQMAKDMSVPYKYVLSENTGTKQVSRGEIVPNRIYSTQVYDLGKLSYCDKIDTNNFVLENPNTSIYVYMFKGGQEGYYTNNVNGAKYVDQYDPINNPQGLLKIQYAISPNGTGSLSDLASTECLDSDTWYDNISLVPGGKTSVTKIRLVISNWNNWEKKLLTNGNKPLFSLENTDFYWTFDTKVKQTATGYSNGAGKNYIPNFASGYLNDLKYTSISAAQTDPTNANFAIKAINGSADRVQLVDNTMAIAKNTLPADKIATSPGAIEEYQISPSLFGQVVGTPTDLTITDTIPSYTDYVPGSLAINTPGDLTTGTSNVSSPTISGNTISWTITGITKTVNGVGSNMPTFKFKVKFRNEAPTGDYLNSVKMTSSDSVLNATALPDGYVTAAKSLRIVAPDGYRINKSENRDLYEVNENISYDLNYSRTGGSVYNPGDFIDILPFNGDNSTSTFVKREDTLTPNPATASSYNDVRANSTAGLASLPTGTNGETFRYTTVVSNTIPNDPCHSANQPAGFIPTVATDPCFLEYGLQGNKYVDGAVTGSGLIPWTTTPPADLGTVTAIRFASTAHPVGGPTRTVKVVIAPKGNKQTDVYCNSFSGRIPEVSLNIVSNDVCAKVVSGTISGSIWRDVNNNGTATNTESEPNIFAAIEVSLLVKDSSGAFVPYIDPETGLALKTSTDSAGLYKFTELPSGTYQTEVTYLRDYGIQTFDLDDGSKPATATPATFISANNSGNLVLVGPAGNIANGTTFTDVSDKPLVNFSYTQPVSISGFNYVDLNNDGIKQATETPIAGTLVTLTGAGLATPLTTNTLADGSYVFANLVPGTYTVTMSQSPLYADGKDTTGVGADTAGTTAQDDKIVGINLTSGQDSITNNFGERLPATISGFNYVDANNDGIKQATEKPISGTLVTLTGAGLATPLTTNTLADGSYSFGPLAPGTYTVTMLQPSAYSDGKDTTGMGSSTSGTTAQDDKIVGVVLYAGEESVDNNFGEIGTTISGFNYVDTNNDGIKQATEKPISGTLVTLTGGNLPVGGITTTTAADGSYTFGNLAAGNYTVTMAQSPLYSDGKDTAGGSGTTAQDDKIVGIVLVANQPSINNNFGELGASISGFNYVDDNNDGIKQATETPIAGTLVTLTGTGLIAPLTTTTLADGSYSFTDLLAGTYTVVMSQPTIYLDGKDTTGTGAATAGTTAQDDKIVGIVLATGNKSINNNFGEILKAAVKIDKTIYAGHTAGAGCPGGDELLIVDKTKAQKAITYCFTVTNTGSTYLKDLTINDPQLSITQANMTLLSGTFPLAPGAKAVWYYQNTTNTSLDNTATVSATPTNSAGLPTGQSAVTDTDTLAKLIYVFDPPIGIKTGTYLGSDVIRWTMTWINTATVTAKGAVVSDPIPEFTTYNGNLVCTGTGTTTVTSCTYEAPSTQYPRGRVVVVSNIGSDVNGTTADNSANELQISFDVLVAPGKDEIFNQAKLAWEGLDAPSQAPTTGGATKVTIPKGIEALIRTGGYEITRNPEPFIAIAMITISGVLASKLTYKKSK
jgi:uncharacterized repeat protein (TIGR01451 family)